MGAGALICQACGATWYSAAAERMSGEQSCPACQGGPLVRLEEAAAEEDEEGDRARSADGP
jgi:hypothetical protein